MYYDPYTGLYVALFECIMNTRQDCIWYCLNMNSIQDCMNEWNTEFCAIKCLNETADGSLFKDHVSKLFKVNIFIFPSHAVSSRILRRSGPQNYP